MTNIEKKQDNSEELARVKQTYIESVSSIIPGDEEEAIAIRNVIHWLQTAQAVNKPLNMEKHLGVLCAVLSPDFRQIFLFKHKKAKLWLPPGGHVDLGLDFIQTVNLEVEEELGVKLPIFDNKPFFLTETLTQGLNAGHIDVTLWYPLIGKPDQSFVIQEKEANLAQWFELSDIYTSPELQHLSRAVSKLSLLY